MNCRKVSHLLSAYMDAELPGVEYRQIHEHLARCPECESEYRGLLHMKRMLGRLRMHEPHQELPDRILQTIRLDTEQQDAHSFQRLLEQWNRILRNTLLTPQTLSLGIGLVVVVALFSAKVFAGADDTVHTVGAIGPNILPAPSDYMTGVDYSAPARFTPQARPMNSYNLPDNVLSQVSAGGALFQPPSQMRPLEQTAWHPR